MPEGLFGRQRKGEMQLAGHSMLATAPHLTPPPPQTSMQATKDLVERPATLPPSSAPQTEEEWGALIRWGS